MNRFEIGNLYSKSYSIDRSLLGFLLYFVLFWFGLVFVSFCFVLVAKQETNPDSLNH